MFAEDYSRARPLHEAMFKVRGVGAQSTRPAPKHASGVNAKLLMERPLHGEGHSRDEYRRVAGTSMIGISRGCL